MRRNSPWPSLGDACSGAVLRGIVLLTLSCGGIAPALGGGTEEDPRAGLSGTFVVCKEYGTVLGTFLADLRGRKIARLNFLFGEDVGPRFSPDGERILFTSTRGGTPGLWIMNRKGEVAKRICDGDQGDWFPDGRRIAFHRKGSIVERSLETGEETVRHPPTWSLSSPSCSPDGQRVVFVGRHPRRSGLMCGPSGGTEFEPLMEGEGVGSPRWSPAGDRIAFEWVEHIWVVDADGRNSRQLTTSGGVQRRPAWSPDGSAIAYCQGPGPRGPWQLAVTRADGTRTFVVPSEGARSVLCSDWGVAEPGKKPTPVRTMAPPPRVRLWELDRPLAEAPADWATFCREKKGWDAVPFGDVRPRSFRGGCVVESDQAVLLMLAERAGAVLVPTAMPKQAVGLLPLDLKSREAGPVESVRVTQREVDEAEVECVSRSGGKWVRVSWRMGGSRPLVWATRGDNASAIRVAVPLRAAVVPDRFANDSVADPGTLGGADAFLPWAPVVAGLFGDGTGMLVAICPEPGQRAALRKGNGQAIAGVDLAFAGAPICVGVVAGERAWHVQRFEAGRQTDPQRFDWRMPFPGAWRLAVQGDAKRYSTFFSDKESAFYDKKDVLVRRGKDFEKAVDLGAIYLYGRTANTPLDALTPIDLVRSALGPNYTEPALDEEGLTGYRVAAKPTTWADLSATLASLRFLFEQKVEVQDNVYAGHLLDDILPFVEGMDQRLAEYERFGQEIASVKAAPAAATLADALAGCSKKLAALAEQRRGLKSAQDALPIVAKIRQLTTKDSSENRKQFEAYCKDLLAAVGPREELLKAYRKLAIEVRDAAGIAPLAQPELLEVAERIRALCQGVLRNRLHIEGDWRGEDYKVPPFWLGPRPYE